jgi:hypothetical protein
MTGMMFSLIVPAARMPPNEKIKKLMKTCIHYLVEGDKRLSDSETPISLGFLFVTFVESHYSGR